MTVPTTEDERVAAFVPSDAPSVNLADFLTDEFLDELDEAERQELSEASASASADADAGTAGSREYRGGEADS